MRVPIIFVIGNGVATGRFVKAHPVDMNHQRAHLGFNTFQAAIGDQAFGHKILESRLSGSRAEYLAPMYASHKL